MPRERVLWTQWGEHARSILRQYHETAAPESGWYGGAYYVTYQQGEFRLCPFGSGVRWRYSFECRPEFIPGQEEPLWTFMVR